MKLLVIFFLVFLFNIAPVFTPPTWMVLSYIKIFYNPNAFLLALIGAMAATAGRLLLAKLSGYFRDRWLKESTKRNIDVIRQKITEHKGITFGAFLFYAFSPFPSNQLFIAYGLTDLKASLIAIPFFIGRLTSYFFWVTIASEAQHHLAAQTFQNKRFFTAYFILVQIATLLVVYLFAKIDWHELLTNKKLKLRK